MQNGTGSFSTHSPQIIENHALSTEELPETLVKY